MRILLSKKALNDYLELPVKLQTLADKQFSLLLRDVRYPSLRAKKYDETRDIWQARLNRDYRFYFLIQHDTYEILTILRHPK